MAYENYIIKTIIKNSQTKTIKITLYNNTSYSFKYSYKDLLKSFCFNYNNNIQNSKASIIASSQGFLRDSNIIIPIYYLLDSNLIATFSAPKCTVYINGEQAISGKTVVKYSGLDTVKVVSSAGKEEKYNISLDIKYANTGLPLLIINTPDSQAITSKTTYIENTSMTIYKHDGSIDFDTDDDLMKIKGRGNTTWFNSYEKKPYVMKLKKRQKF